MSAPVPMFVPRTTEPAGDDDIAPLQRLVPHVREYVTAVARRAAAGDPSVVSVVVFGSAVTGGFVGAASDVDMILVVADGTPHDARLRLRHDIEQLEVVHGFRAGYAPPERRLERFARVVTANVRSFFTCTRSDLLSGDPARILGISRTQALFVDRVVVPNILHSAVTAWGEDLLQIVPVRPIRRLDVLKAWHGLASQVLLAAAMYPFVSAATQYAAGALKRSVHNCYFIYHLQPAALADEVAFLQQRQGRSRTLEDVLALRERPRRSAGFLFRCIPAITRLHLRTALDNRFPRHPGR
jgi:predicted nucleotidyltransferase